MFSRSRARRILCPALVLLLSCLSGIISAATLRRADPPLFFEPNQGQAPSSVRYILRDGVAEAALRDNGLDFILPGRNHSTSTVSLQFIHADPSPAFTPLERLPGISNYLIGADASRWVRNVPNFARVRYQNIYPGIDAVFYGNGHRLEHDFDVAPGADPAKIALHFDGARRLALTSAGDLEIDLPAGSLTLQRPIAYQVFDGVRGEVAVDFVLARNGFGFKVGRYDTARELIIDPTLVYSTYLDALPSIPNAITTDAAGNSYIAGTTDGLPFPTTAGSFMSSCPTCSLASAYVTKLNAAGTAQIFSTLLGGTGGTEANSIAVDPAGNVIVGGYTAASDFPTKNPIVPQPLGGAFVTSLTPDGSALNYSTVITSDAGITVASDSQGGVYFAGSLVYSGEIDYPVTPGALNTPGGTEFLTKISSSGSLIYSAFLGSAQIESGGFQQAIAVDGNGAVYITGFAYSWPTTAGAYLTQPPAAGAVAQGIFLSKISPDGSKFTYSTWIADAYVIGLAVDSKGDAWIAANTGVFSPSTPYPITANAFNSTVPTGPSYAYTELSADGSQLLYSSFFPERSPALGATIAVDHQDNVWLAGKSQDPAFAHRRSDRRYLH